MREIKFRAWDSTNNVWADKGPFHVIGEVTLFDLLKQYQFEHLNDLVIEQYTGLHDKNGVEIYEGDVLLHTRKRWIGEEGRFVYDSKHRLIGLPTPIYENMEPVQVGPVEWLECGAWFPFADDDDDLPYVIPGNCEVIGNIHENPELLEDGNER